MKQKMFKVDDQFRLTQNENKYFKYLRVCID